MALKLRNQLRVCLCASGYLCTTLWDAAVGETLVSARETRNVHDSYEVAVEKNSTVIGHLPEKVSHVCLCCVAERIHFLESLENKVACSVTESSFHFFAQVWHFVSTLLQVMIHCNVLCEFNVCG